MKKQEQGNSTIISAIFMIEILMIMFVFSFRMNVLRYEVEFVDDALSAAVLASVYLNLEEYGTSNQIVIHETDIGKDVVGNATQYTYAGRELNPMQDEYLVESYITFANALGYNMKLHTYESTGIQTNYVPENQSVLRGASGELDSRVRVLDYIVYNVYIDPIKRPATDDELAAAGLSNATDADNEEPNDAFIDSGIPNVDEIATDNGMVAINGSYYVIDGYVKTIYEYVYDISANGELQNIRLTNKYQCLSASSDAAITYDMGVTTPAGEPVLYTTVYANIGFCVVPFASMSGDENSRTFYKEKQRAVEVQTVIGTS